MTVPAVQLRGDGRHSDPLGLAYRGLSDQYNLGLSRPPADLPAAQATLLPDANIFQAFKFLWHRGLGDEVLARFEDRLRLLPRNQGMALHASAPPATTIAEQADLKDALLAVLGEVRREFLHQPQSSKATSATLPSKRSLDGNQDVRGILTLKKTRNFSLGKNAFGSMEKDSAPSETRSAPAGGEDLSSSLQDLVLEDFPMENELASTIRYLDLPLPISSERRISVYQPMDLDSLGDVAGNAEPDPPSDGSSEASGWATSEETQTTADESRSSLVLTKGTTSDKLDERFAGIWPETIPSLLRAPLPIMWEVHRVLSHCNVHPCEFRLSYDPAWKSDQDAFWAAIRSLDVLHEKVLPPRSSTEAWNASFNGFRQQHRVVVLSARLEYNLKSDGPMFFVKLDPLHLELPYRLSRRFGSDRFLELVMPALEDLKPPTDRNEFKDQWRRRLCHWLRDGPHHLLGRSWEGFFIRPVSSKTSKERTRAENDSFKPRTASDSKVRITLLAEHGNDIDPRDDCTLLPEKGETTDPHTRLKVFEMLDWLLEPRANQKQPYLKLFARIALGLSKTYATTILEPNQIRHRKHDIMSPSGKVMNDGIGQMSRGLARAIREVLNLSDTPCGFQGRIGSAKGFWIIDNASGTDEKWIETYPSQRKWVCSARDEDHRTFEVRAHVTELRPAHLNAQFLPILESRANDKDRMKRHIGDLLLRHLESEFEQQMTAFENPSVSRKWIHDNFAGSTRRRMEVGEPSKIPFVASLPKSKEDRMAFLLDGGFHPTKQKFLWDIGQDLRREKCDELKKKLNIKIGCSTIAYVVIDFLGVLREDEVHLAFSSKFQDPASEFSGTHLHDVEVLLARSPAHFESDIQKRRAIFHPELGHLKDVVVFPRTGEFPLADMLSGGDYDGDMVFVCWDQEIVGNFESVPAPQTPDLFEQGVLTKDKRTYSELVRDRQPSPAMKLFLDEAFAFNTLPNMLGKCTNYKEALCYERRRRGNALGDDVAVAMSTLLSSLVDQAKQGIIFSSEQWKSFLEVLLGGRPALPVPRYKDPKHKFWTEGAEPDHILDYLKFKVVYPAIERHMKAVENTGGKNFVNAWDPDLVELAKHYEALADTEEDKSKGLPTLLQRLTEDIEAFSTQWIETEDEFLSKVETFYEVYRAISPRSSSNIVNRMVLGNGHPDHSEWAKLKASNFFRKNFRHPYVWWLAGRQFQALKAEARSSEQPAVPVTAAMWLCLRPDSKLIKATDAHARSETQIVESRNGYESEFEGYETAPEDYEDDDFESCEGVE